MKANYHTHTWRCHHAEPDERAYVESALSTGMEVLGFSDHVPYPFDNGFYSGMRMGCDQVQDYMDTLLALRQSYKGRIDIRIGFEAEYFPSLFPRLLEMLEPFPYEYLILGQHFLDSEQGGAYMGAATEDAAQLIRYVDQSCEALATGAFSCFAHPDIIHFTGDRMLYREQMRRLCREAKACAVPLEINLLGLGTHRQYPAEAFWEEAAVVGNDVVLGWDAHAAAWMQQPDLEAAGEDMIRRLGLHRIYSLALVRPSGGR